MSVSFSERIKALEVNQTNMERNFEIEREERKGDTEILFKKIDQIGDTLQANRENVDAKVNKLSKIVWMGVGAIAGIEFLLRLIGK